MNDNSKLAKPIRRLTSLVRPKYSPGLLLQDDDLTTAVSYTRNLSRLLFRTLFGCGVLCGLKVEVPSVDKCGKLRTCIGGGVALSCAGDPVEVLGPQEIVIDSCETELPCALWFAVRHTETCCVPRTAQCPPDEGEPPCNYTRDRDGFEIRVFAERPPCSCGCARLGPEPPPPVEIYAELRGAKSVRGAKDKVMAKDIGGRDRHAAISGPAPTTAPGPAASPTPGAPCPETETLEPPPTGGRDPCLCNLRTGTYGPNNEIGACYRDHYEGKCPCECCDCDWIILAVAKREGDTTNWLIDHSVRRFVRPVLMRDPVVEKERAAPGS